MLMEILLCLCWVNITFLLTKFECHGFCKQQGLGDNYYEPFPTIR